MSLDALSAIETSPGAGFSSDEPAWRMLVHEREGKILEPLALSLLGGTAIFADTSLSPRLSLYAGFGIVGLTAPEVSSGLGLAENTIDTHYRQLFSALGIHKRSAIADVCFSSDDTVLIMRENASPHQLESLSYMERSIALLITTGATDAEIAERFDRHPKTIARYVSRIGDRVGVTGRTALASLMVFAGQTGVEADPEAANHMLTKRVARALSGDNKQASKLVVLRGKFSDRDD